MMVATTAAVVVVVMFTLLATEPGHAAVNSRRPERQAKGAEVIKAAPTETMGNADTTPTINENTDAKDNWPATWPKQNIQRNYTWFYSYPPTGETGGEKTDKGTGSTPGPPKYESIFPTFDPDFEAHATKGTKILDGYMLVCQSYYAMVYVRGHHDCSTLIFQEKVWDYYQRKDCLPTPNPEWFWTYPWVPNAIHLIHVRDRSTKRLITKETFFCLEVVPPAIQFKRTLGIQWIMYAFPRPIEREPNLIGYNLYTKVLHTSMDWIDNIVAFVTYNESFPISRPTHPCDIFRKNNTFCVLSFDFLTNVLEATNTVEAALLTFRITPGPFSMFLVDRLSYDQDECFWHQPKCPVIPQPGGDPAFRYRFFTEPTTVAVHLRTTIMHVEMAPEELLMFSEKAITDESSRGYREEDLFIFFLGLFLLLLFIFGPFVWFLGRRAGFKNAQARWSYLAAVPGTVSVPLGHGGSNWRGRT